MTDIENIIINRINNVLEAAGYHDILKSDYEDVPSEFPCVFFQQFDSYEHTEQHSSSRENNFDTVVFEGDIYSNLNNGARSECKAIVQIIDAEMVSLGFSRTTNQALKPSSPTYKARRFVRYRGVVDTNKYIYHI